MSDFCGQGIELSAEKAKCNKTLSSASPWPQTNVIQCDRCRGNPRKGDGMDNCVEKWLCFSLLLFLPPLCSRYRWLPSRRGGVSGFGVPPASMRRAADQNGGGGRHNWGQGFRLGDQWRSGLWPAHQPPLRWRFLPVPGDLYHRVLANAVGPDPHWM